MKAPPSALSVLRVKHNSFLGPTSGVHLSEIVKSLDSPALKNLRQLYLPSVLREELSAAESQELAEACDARGSSCTLYNQSLGG